MRPAAPSTGRDLPGWGLGDVALGIALGVVLSTVAGAILFPLAGWETTDRIPLWATALLQLPLWAGWLIALGLASRKGGDLRQDLKVRWSVLPDLPLGLVLGVGVQLVLVPLLYLPVLRLLGRTTDDLSRPARELAEKAQGAWGWVVFAVIVVVLAPVLEEVFYRGLLLQSLRKRGLGDVVACLVCGAVFGAVHLQALQFVGLFVLGTILSFLVVRTDRLGPAIVAHMAFNATTVVVLYLQR